MREILFRAKPVEYKWNNKKKEYIVKRCNNWIFGKLLTNGRIITIPDKEVEAMCCFDMCDYQEPIDEDTLGQYTGVKDKNGKKVFDGDIIYLEEEHLYGRVCWESLRWYVYWYGWIDKEGIGTVFDIVNENPLQDELLTSEEKIWLHVIGNIWDNPELLKGENLYDRVE